MEREACTPAMLQAEADAMYDGDIAKLREFIHGLYDDRGHWSGARLHLEEDLVTLERMIDGAPA